MTEETFDIELEGLTLEQVALMVMGVGSVGVRMAQASGTKQPLLAADDLLKKAAKSNPDAIRGMFLDEEVSDHIHAYGQFDDEMMDLLDLEVHDGKVIDTRGMEDIDVE